MSLYNSFSRNFDSVPLVQDVKQNGLAQTAGRNLGLGVKEIGANFASGGEAAADWTKYHWDGFFGAGGRALGEGAHAFGEALGINPTFSAQPTQQPVAQRPAPQPTTKQPERAPQGGSFEQKMAMLESMLRQQSQGPQRGAAPNYGSYAPQAQQGWQGQQAQPQQQGQQGQQQQQPTQQNTFNVDDYVASIRAERGLGPQQDERVGGGDFNLEQLMRIAMQQPRGSQSLVDYANTKRQAKAAQAMFQQVAGQRNNRAIRDQRGDQYQQTFGEDQRQYDQDFARLREYQAQNQGNVDRRFERGAFESDRTFGRNSFNADRSHQYRVDRANEVDYQNDRNDFNTRLAATYQQGQDKIKNNADANARGIKNLAALKSSLSGKDVEDGMMQKYLAKVAQDPGQMQMLDNLMNMQRSYTAFGENNAIAKGRGWGEQDLSVEGIPRFQQIETPDGQYKTMFGSGTNLVDAGNARDRNDAISMYAEKFRR